MNFSSYPFFLLLLLFYISLYISCIHHRRKVQTLQVVFSLFRSCISISNTHTPASYRKWTEFLVSSSLFDPPRRIWQFISEQISVVSGITNHPHPKGSHRIIFECFLKIRLQITGKAEGIKGLKIRCK